MALSFLPTASGPWAKDFQAQATLANGDQVLARYKAAAVRLRVHNLFVVDASGSMAGQPTAAVVAE